MFRAGLLARRLSKAIVQRPAPPFTAKALLPSGRFGTVSLSQYAGRYLVLYFYPLDFTFVCPTEIIQLSEMTPQFAAIGCDIVGVSTDSIYSHAAWAQMPRREGGIKGMAHPLVTDTSHAITKDYGVLVEGEGIALRGLFIIDDKQIVRHVTINDLGIGRDGNEVLRVVQAIQFNDKHGEMCPAGWKPKSKAIDTKNAFEFFERTY